MLHCRCLCSLLASLVRAMTKKRRSVVLTSSCGRCAAVHRRRAQAPALGRHFQPEPISPDLGHHSGPLLVRLAGAQAARAVGPQPLLHPRLVPVAGQTHLPMGQAPDQTPRLVGAVYYANHYSFIYRAV